jgi:site-specific DNA recombinase
MTPSHAARQGKRYRYYLFQPDDGTDRAMPVWRMPAAEIELLVTAEVKAVIRQAQERAIASGRLSGDAIEVLADRCSAVIVALDQDAPARVREQLLVLVERIDVGEGSLHLTLRLDSIDPLLGDQPLACEVAIGFVQTSRQVKIAIPPPADHQQAPSPLLLKLVPQAFAARAEMDQGGTFDAVADRLGCGREYLADLIRTS